MLRTLSRPVSHRFRSLLAPRPKTLSFSSTRHARRSQYLILAQDIQDPTTQQRRSDARPSHLKSVKDHLASGACLLGGAMLNDGLPIGSALILEAETVEEVRSLIRSDPYVTEGVWDVQRIQIIPFKLAVEGFTARAAAK